MRTLVRQNAPNARRGGLANAHHHPPEEANWQDIAFRPGRVNDDVSPHLSNCEANSSLLTTYCN
jgi:hypothetical protein